MNCCVSKEDVGIIWHAKTEDDNDGKAQFKHIPTYIYVILVWIQWTSYYLTFSILETVLVILM